MKRPYPSLRLIRGGLLARCPQPRRRDPSAALVVILCGAVLGLAGIGMAVAFLFGRT